MARDKCILQNGCICSEVNDSSRVVQFRKDLTEKTGCIVPFDDAYLASVLAVPGRTYEYALDKMISCIKWRLEYNINTLAVAEVARELASGSMYWYGYDYCKRPILWVRPVLKNWKDMDREKEIRAHVLLIEAGCRELMPSGVTTFTLIADSSGLGLRQVDIGLMKGLAEVCVKNYPDRIGKIYIGPVNAVVKVLTKVLTPLLPLRLREKLHFMTNSDNLLDIIPEIDLPTFFRGSAIHKQHKDDSQSFDYSFMMCQQIVKLKSLDMKQHNAVVKDDGFQCIDKR